MTPAPDTGWTEVVAVVAAYLIAVVTTPAGISGAVLLLPFQDQRAGHAQPIGDPTNLLYNVVATPGALYRYWRQGQTGDLPDSGGDDRGRLRTQPRRVSNRDGSTL